MKYFSILSCLTDKKSFCLLRFLNYFVSLPKILRFVRKMKKILFAFWALISVMACGDKSKAPYNKEQPVQQNEPGDSTRYGLACDGCTDSILLLLPFDGGDPDTFDIISAYQNRKIYGRPRIGDELAVILNPEDKEEALMIINIERLKGQWCYQVMPTFRNIEKMPQKMQRRMMAQIPDSVKQRLLVPREYGIQLKRGHLAQTIGSYRSRHSDSMSPVEYPKVRRYAGWKLFNGRLVLETDTARLIQTDQAHKPEYDTADIVSLRRDTLVLRFKDHEQTYYRKKDS